MEAAAAVELWGRSEIYNMLYGTFVSDGDSSACQAVCDMYKRKGPYGKEHEMEKAECINHVAKRLVTGLCGLKKGSGKTVGGKNKLTDVVIDHLQFYFQVNLSRKIGTTPSEVRCNSVNSLLLHFDRRPSTT